MTTSTVYHPKIELHRVETDPKSLTAKLSAYIAEYHRGLSLSEFIFYSVLEGLGKMLKAAGQSTEPDRWLSGTQIDYKAVSDLLSPYLVQQEANNSQRLSKSFGASYTGDCLLMRSLPLAGFYPEKRFVAEWVLSARLGDVVSDALGVVMNSIEGLLAPQRVWNDKGRVGDMNHSHSFTGLEVSYDRLHLGQSKRLEMEEANASCRADFFLSSKKGVTVGDFKSNEDAKYWREYGGWPGWQENKVQHWARQVATGIYHLEGSEIVPSGSGRILEIGRNSFQFREYYFEMTQELREWKREEVATLKVARRQIANFNEKHPVGSAGREQYISDELPAAETWKGNCKFCDFKRYCPASEEEKGIV